METKKFLDVLNKELVVAIGCTEPVAVAYATAIAAKQFDKSEIESITVYVSGNILKNALAVGIPGTNATGINLAAALGSLAENIEQRMELLKGVSLEDVVKAKGMIQNGRVSVDQTDSEKKLYIEVYAKNAEKTCRVIIEDSHTNVTLVEVNGVKKQLVSSKRKTDRDDENPYPFLNLQSIWDFIQQVDLAELDIVRESIRLNKEIATEGLTRDYGLKIGRTMLRGLLKEEPIDISRYAMALTAAGSDARMAGSELPVMSNTGSGNQGLSATLPVVAIAEKMGIDEEKVLRAVTLSHLVTIYIKSKFGRLSALCGVTISATGASCGIVYLLGGDLQNVKAAVQNMMGNVTGMICDGAKSGCALKVSTCTSAALQSAAIALEGITIKSTDGIIDEDPEQTIQNMCRIGNQGTAETERIILDIMLAKANCG